MCVPLILQNRLSMAESFVTGHSRLEKGLVTLLDSWCHPNFSLEEICRYGSWTGKSYSVQMWLFSLQIRISSNKSSCEIPYCVTSIHLWVLTTGLLDYFLFELHANMGSLDHLILISTCNIWSGKWRVHAGLSLSSHRGPHPSDAPVIQSSPLPPVSLQAVPSPLCVQKLPGPDPAQDAHQASLPSDGEIQHWPRCECESERDRVPVDLIRTQTQQKIKPVWEHVLDAGRCPNALHKRRLDTLRFLMYARFIEVRDAKGFICF